MNSDPFKDVAGHQRVSHIDGHLVNESYKMPSSTGKMNSSYMHPHIKPLDFQAPWSSADKTLAETSRPSSQLGRSKTVFPVSQDKARGVPHPPSIPRTPRTPGHSAFPGVVLGPEKPTTF